MVFSSNIEERIPQWHTTLRESKGDCHSVRLDRWMRKHNIKRMTISVESGNVSGVTVESWKER